MKDRNSIIFRVKILYSVVPKLLFCCWTIIRTLFRQYLLSAPPVFHHFTEIFIFSFSEKQWLYQDEFHFNLIYHWWDSFIFLHCFHGFFYNVLQTHNFCFCVKNLCGWRKSINQPLCYFFFLKNLPYSVDYYERHQISTTASQQNQSINLVYHIKMFFFSVWIWRDRLRVVNQPFVSLFSRY